MDDTRTGIDHQPRQQSLCRQVGDRRDDGGRRQHPGLDAAHREVVEHRLDLLPHEPGSRATTPRTSAVFCAVTAVRAHVPCTRSAAKVFRSAWAPAPPPESEPAMVSAVGGVGSGTEPP